MPRIALIVLVIALSMAAAAASGKEPDGAMYLCGDERCIALQGEAQALASAILVEPAPAPKRPAAFFELVSVHDDGRGRPALGGAIRYVPSARAARTAGPSGKALWSRVDWVLAGHLRQAADGLIARPAAALDDPPAAVGAAASALERSLADAAPSGAQPAPVAPADEGGELAGAAAGVSWALALLFALALAHKLRLLVSGRAATDPLAGHLARGGSGAAGLLVAALAVEAAVLVALLAARPAGLVAAAVLMVGYALLLRRLPPQARCHCFGAATSSSAAVAIRRNLALAILAVASAAASTGTGAYAAETAAGAAAVILAALAALEVLQRLPHGALAQGPT